MWLHLPRKRTDSSIQHNPSLTPPMLIPETFKPTLWHFRCHCWSVYETKFPSQDSSQYTLHVSISHHQMKCKRQTLSTLFHLGEIGVFDDEPKRQCTRTGYTTVWSYYGWERARPHLIACKEELQTWLIVHLAILCIAISPFRINANDKATRTNASLQRESQISSWFQIVPNYEFIPPHERFQDFSE